MTSRIAKKHRLSPLALRPYLVFFLVLGLFFSLAFMVRLPADVRDPLDSSMDLALLSPPVPDFTAIDDVNLRKDEFFAFLRPYVDDMNREILDTRTQIESLLDKVVDGRPLTRRERSYLAEVSREYQVQPQLQFSENHLRTLLRRVDVIPASLVLAQAANESAWGTSRFAIEGNNYFGQWCYSEGCGLVPSQRRRNATHEVRAFDSVTESVRAYFMNINTFGSYQHLRMIRQELRELGKPLDGVSLAEGLEHYSERGQDYIQELQSMIEFNALDDPGPSDA